LGGWPANHNLNVGWYSCRTTDPFLHWRVNPMKFSDYIIRDPKILNEAPLIKGTHIPLDAVLRQLAAGDSPEKIIKTHPALSLESVRAVVAFAAASSRRDPGKLPSAQKPNANKKAKTLQILRAMLKKNPGDQRVEIVLARLEKGSGAARKTPQTGSMTMGFADQLIGRGLYAQAAKVLAYL